MLKNWFNKFNSDKEKRNIKIDSNNNSQTANKKDIQDEWIWVEGFKGTDKDIKCNGLQYKIGERFIHKENIELCKFGLHFCINLADVFSYYKINFSNRFFKVKGLVKKSSYNKAIAPVFCSFSTSPIDSKVVAKEIVLLEELTYGDLEKYIKKQYPFIETEKEYTKCDNYASFVHNKFIKEMGKLGFSDIYSLVQTKKLYGNDLYYFLKAARGYVAEGISKDLMIYLLEANKQQYNMKNNGPIGIF